MVDTLEAILETVLNKYLRRCSVCDDFATRVGKDPIRELCDRHEPSDEETPDFRYYDLDQAEVVRRLLTVRAISSEGSPVELRINGSTHTTEYYNTVETLQKRAKDLLADQFKVLQAMRGPYWVGYSAFKLGSDSGVHIVYTLELNTPLQEGNPQAIFSQGDQESIGILMLD